MTRHLRPATHGQTMLMDEAISLLRIAVNKLKCADCPKALEKTRLALKSAEGAQRHMRHRYTSDDNPFHPESPKGRAYDRGDRSSIE